MNKGVIFGWRGGKASWDLDILQRI